MKGAKAFGYARFVIADRSAILPPGRVRRAVSTTSVLFYSRSGRGGAQSGTPSGRAAGRTHAHRVDVARVRVVELRSLALESSAPA